MPGSSIDPRQNGHCKQFAAFRTERTKRRAFTELFASREEKLSGFIVSEQFEARWAMHLHCIVIFAAFMTEEQGNDTAIGTVTTKHEVLARRREPEPLQKLVDLF
jgi:hypothetical protein